MKTHYFWTLHRLQGKLRAPPQLLLHRLTVPSTLSPCRLMPLRKHNKLHMPVGHSLQHWRTLQVNTDNTTDKHITDPWQCSSVIVVIWMVICTPTKPYRYLDLLHCHLGYGDVGYVPTPPYVGLQPHCLCRIPHVEVTDKHIRYASWHLASKTYTWAHWSCAWNPLDDNVCTWFANRDPILIPATFDSY